MLNWHWNFCRLLISRRCCLTLAARPSGSLIYTEIILLVECNPLCVGFLTLIKELANRRANRNIKIAEITPHLYNKGLNKKIKIVNNYVKSLCELEQIGFIEFWEKFENQIKLYVKYGSQLNKKGRSKLRNILTDNCLNDFLV